MLLFKPKNLFIAGFLGIATTLVIASCANDTSAGVTSEKTSSADTSAVIPAGNSVSPDSSVATRSVIKRKTGKVSSAMLSSGSTGVKIEKDKLGVYSRAEQMPEYPGGEKALSRFVESHINYPDNAIDQNTEGTVTVSFVVDEKGKVMLPVTSGNKAGNGLDEEAIKVVKQMPVWKPGMVRGKPVKTRLSLPVTFKLDS